ncbi:unnamed protein product [Schistocephalus solidus]|uniref:Uncharacterized protein n=1 Tax=Schistocephalus solidus TaxID=70667 RepID=A0A183T6E3_SCHSO|nr:unnamed protein product [Schistocephalus solidus]
MGKIILQRLQLLLRPHREHHLIQLLLRPHREHLYGKTGNSPLISCAITRPKSIGWLGCLGIAEKLFSSGFSFSYGPIENTI